MISVFKLIEHHENTNSKMLMNQGSGCGGGVAGGADPSKARCVAFAPKDPTMARTCCQSQAIGVPWIVAQTCSNTIPAMTISIPTRILDALPSALAIRSFIKFIVL
jgi:hypothetical protein